MKRRMIKAVEEAAKGDHKTYPSGFEAKSMRQPTNDRFQVETLAPP